MAGYFYLRESPVDGQPITLNGAVYVFGGILKCVLASAADADIADVATAAATTLASATAVGHPQQEHHHPNRSHILRISNSVTLYLVIDHKVLQ